MINVGLINSSYVASKSKWNFNIMQINILFTLIETGFLSPLQDWVFSNFKKYKPISTMLKSVYSVRSLIGLHGQKVQL